ncbi:MMPL family transporter [Sphingomonas sp.]|uniref:MMPL family transporter n=1 Tax=Sphingomonas sp. TaxID=28214 RepID=UPI003B00CF30
MTHPLGRAAGLACRRPRTVLVATLILVVASLAFAGLRFRMTTDATDLIAPTVPWRLAERRMDAAFPRGTDVIVAVVDGRTPELARTGAASLAARLAADRAHFRAVSRPDGGPFFDSHGLLFAELAQVRAATDAMVKAQPFLGPLAADPSLRGIATTVGTFVRGVATGNATLGQFAKPMAALAGSLDARAAGQSAFFSWQAMLAAGGPAAPTRQLVIASPVLDYDALSPGAAAEDAVRAAAAGLRLDPAHGVTVRLTGNTPLSDEEFASLTDNWWLVAGAMILAMLATLRLATGSWRATAAILLTTLAGLAVTTAAGLAMVGTLNLISIAFIPLFVGLGVDFGIQLAVRFQAERHGGMAPADAIAAATGAIGHQLLLAAGAVALGFLAFLPTDYVGIAELGLIAAVGMVVALGLSVTMLPALLLLLPPPRPAAEIGSPGLASADAWLARHRRAVLIAFVAGMGLSIATLPLVRFDFDPLNLRPADSEAMRTLRDLAADPLRDPNTIELLAQDLPRARALAKRLAALPEVGGAVTIESFVPADQGPKLAAIADAQALLGFSLDPLMALPPPTDAETATALGDTARALAVAARTGGPGAEPARRLAAAFARLAFGSSAARATATDMLVPPLAAMLDQLRAILSATPVTLATLPADLRDDWVARDGQVRIELTAARGYRDETGLRRFVRAVTAVAPQAGGPAVSAQGAAGTIAGAFVEAGLLALAAVSLLLVLMLRSVRETAFTLAPVVLSGFLTLGTCVAIGQPINFANIIAFPLLFGVGVAFHIYFVVAWRNGEGALLASPLARAIFFSALATGTAFGSLWLSHHPGTASMGKILLISLAWTLVCALVFEPALLGPISRRRAA